MKKVKQEKRKRKQKFEPFEPLGNQLGIAGTSYRVQLGVIDGKKAIRLLKGNKEIGSYIFTDKDLGE